MAGTTEKKVMRGGLVATLRDWIKEKLSEKQDDVSLSVQDGKICVTYNE